MCLISTACLACLMLLSVTCKKDDHCIEPPKKDSTCELVQSFEGQLSQYRKVFDDNGKVIKVVAGLYTLGLFDSVAMLVQYKGSTVYLLDELNPADTFSTVTFDAQHWLKK
jgi:hypothetical protein